MIKSKASLTQKRQLFHVVFISLVNYIKEKPGNALASKLFMYFQLFIRMSWSKCFENVKKAKSPPYVWKNLIF